MKRGVFAVSALSCLGGFLLIWGLTVRIPLPRELRPLTPQITPRTAITTPDRFVGLPVDGARVVDFEADASALEQLTAREIRDQFRDWLLYAAASSAGLSPEQLNQSLYDVPAIRHGYMKSVSNLDYGETRWCSIGYGEILALIPTSTGPRREAFLAEIADAARKNLGTEPRTVSVVEYELDIEDQSGTLTRRASVDGHDFFTEKAGYYQNQVESLAKFQEFLARVDDVTFASLEQGSLVLGGRKIADHTYKGIRAEDVAAIWQAEQKLHSAISTFEASIKHKQDSYNAESKRQFDELNRAWSETIDRLNERLRSGLVTKKSRFGGIDTPTNKDIDISRLLKAIQNEDKQNEISGIRRRNRLAAMTRESLDNASVIDEAELRQIQDADFEALKQRRAEVWKQVEREVIEEQSKTRFLRGSGFSLDPDYDFPGLAAFASKMADEFEAFSKGRGPAAIKREELEAIRTALLKGDRRPHRLLIERLEAGEGPLAQALLAWLRQPRSLISFDRKIDANGLAKKLERFEAELSGLLAERWPDGSPSDFAEIRKALDSGNEKPFRDWIDRANHSEGLLSKAVAEVASEADVRYHNQTVVDRAGLVSWLARLESESRLLANRNAPSSPRHVLKSAIEALSRKDDTLCRTLIVSWKNDEGFLLGSLGAMLHSKAPSYGLAGKIDHEGLADLLKQVDQGLEGLVTGALSPGTVALVREAVAKGDDSALGKLALKPDENPSLVRSQIGSRLERTTTRFRGCDTEALSAYLVEMTEWSHSLVSGKAPLLSPASVKGIREGLDKSGGFGLLLMAYPLQGASDNKLANELADALSLTSDAYREPDLAGLAQGVAELAEQLPGLPEILAIDQLRSASSALSSEVKSAQGRGKEADQAVVPLLIWEDRLQKSESLTARYLSSAVSREFRKYRFQMARYDGDLKGTEVGMVLFYTDLLAKLWAIDFLHNQPGRLIEDFHSMTDQTLSPIFEEEMRKLSSTRLWFGHEDKGFQVASEGNSLILSRNATRIYAASSSPLAPGKETPAAAGSEAFLGWWNDHYLDVARYEPQYERLNEIMKWSLLISWLNEKGRGNALGFLNEVSVDHSKWFPDWAKAQPDLRFRRWDRIAFFEPGYKGSVTEAMPILASDPYIQFGQSQTLSGGVSLAPQELFKSRSAVAGEVNPLLRRSNVNYAVKSESGGPVSFKTFQESQYTFRPIEAGKSAVEAIPKEGTKLRGRVSEIKTPKFERTVAKESGRVELASKVGERDLAVMSVQPTKNGLRVGLRSRELSTAQELARKASVSPDPVASLALHPEVEAVIGTPDGLLVRKRGSSTWTELSVKELDGSVARVADTRVGASPQDIAFLEAPAVKAALEKGESIAIRIPESGGEGLPIRLSARGPPAETKLVPVEISWRGGEPLKGRLDPVTREVHFDRDAISRVLIDDPARLREVLRKSDLTRIEFDPKRTGPVRTEAKEALIADSPLLREIEQGEFPKLTRTPSESQEAFASRIKTEIESRIRTCDELLRDGQNSRALEILQNIEDSIGATPDLRLRQGIAEIQIGRNKRGVKHLNEAMESKSDISKINEEINGRLTDRGLDPSVRENLQRVQDAIRWRDLKAAGKAPEGDLALTFGPDGVGLEYRTSKEFPIGEEVTVKQVLENKEPVFAHQDLPGLNNLDSPASFQEALPSLVELKFAKVVSIPDAAIADFKPTTVFVEAKAIAGPSAKKSSTGGNFAKGTRYKNVRPEPSYRSSYSGGAGGGSGGGGPPPDDDDEEEKRKKAEALQKALAEAEAAKQKTVVIEQKPAARVAYLIIPLASGK